MLTRRIRLQVIAFVVVGLVAISYLGARYVGIGNWFGDDGYQVSARLPETGGVFTNAEVTYRGVPVGRVGALTLTEDGVDVALDIDPGAPPIPSDVEVAVADRSAIGEQYVDLRPRTGGAPYLAGGDVVTGSQESLPPDIGEVLRSSRDFAASVPLDDLRTVVDESYDAFQGSGDDLRRLLDTSQDFIGTADRNILVTSSLIESSDTVLATQQESAASIRGFSGNLKDLAAALKSSDGDLRRLITTTPAAAKQVDLLFREVGMPLGVLLSNLVTPAQVFGTNAAGVRDLLSGVPKAVGIGYATTTSTGLRLGLETTFFDPLPCTSGYSGTVTRPGLDTAEGQAFNTDAGCTVAPSSGSDVRGPRSAPGADTTTLYADRPGSITVPSTLAELMGGR